MTDLLRAAAQAALEALERSRAYVYETDRQQVDDAMDGLRAALAERGHLRDATKMIGEPVAYMYTYHGPEGWGDRLEFPGARWQGPGYNHMPNNWRETPLYAAPPRREWKGLTEANRLDIRTLWNCKPDNRLDDLMKMTEAALKEKNT